jgi:hypothetical protein
MPYQRVPAREDEERDRNDRYDGRKDDQRHRRGNSLQAVEPVTVPGAEGVGLSLFLMSSFLKASRGHGYLECLSRCREEVEMKDAYPVGPRLWLRWNKSVLSRA